jgi:protein-disulfide isomerase
VESQLRSLPQRNLASSPTITFDERSTLPWYGPLIVSAIGLSVLIAGQLLSSSGDVEIQTVENEIAAEPVLNTERSSAGTEERSRETSNGDEQATPAPVPAPDNTVPMSSVEPTQAATMAPPADSGHVITLFAGRVKLDIRRHPFMGDWAAEHVFVKLFDYTCPDCHRAHDQLERYVREHQLSVAIVLIPVPMNRGCNPYVEKTGKLHVEACEYTKLALAVFESDGTKFESFHRWMMREQSPPTLPAATEFAETLVGREPLHSAMEDLRVVRRMDDYISLFHLCRAGVVPKLIVNDQMIAGSPPEYAKMEAALDRLFARQHDSATSR